MERGTGLALFAMGLAVLIVANDFTALSVALTDIEADLESEVELRALERGNIEILDSSPTRLRPGSYVLPEGWSEQPTTRGPEGPLVLKGATHG